MKQLSIQRMMGLMITLALLFTAALAVQPVSAAGLIVVNTANDDLTAGDGLCTLREAITNANTDTDTTSGDCASGSGADTITFAGNYTITLAGSQLPAITSLVTITGNNPINTILQAAATPATANYRVMEVGVAGDLTLTGVTIQYGVCNGSCETSLIHGAGIYNVGSLSITNSAFYDNRASGTVGSGGGVYSTGNLSVIGSTFANNSAVDWGGGLVNVDGYAYILNSTFSGNQVTYEFGGGGGISGYGIALTNISSTTITNNLGGISGGLANPAGGTMNLFNTLIANSTGPDCSDGGTFLANFNNLIEDKSCGNMAFRSGDPNLGPLADNKGPTLTHALLEGSIAIDFGDFSSCPGTDQRGAIRLVGATCDIGAYEYDLAQTGSSYYVTGQDDIDDGVCGVGHCSLREAINSSNLAAGANTILFNNVAWIDLDSQLPVVSTEITIFGDGPASTKLQADPTPNTANHRVLEVSDTGILTLNSMTISNGVCDGACNTFPQHGGGILNAGFLAINNSTISSNQASSGTNGSGGGIYSTGALLISSSTFTGNQAYDFGGGLVNVDGSATITNSTFSGNTVLGIDSQGGGLSGYGAADTTLYNTTISDNSGSLSGGLANPVGGMMYLTNTIVANSAGFDCSAGGTFGGNSNNLIEDMSCGNMAYLSGDPNLGPLTNNGGLTDTHALLDGSIAIDSGTNLNCPLTDQRGITRPQHETCDIGAYEVLDVTAPTVVSILRAGAPTTSNTSVLFTVTFSESVKNINTKTLGDFSLTTTGLTGATITSVSGSGATYTVTVSTGTGTGTLRLNLVDGDTILDGSNNPLGGSGIGNGDFNTGETYIVNKYINLLGDFNGDGSTEIAVFRPSNGTWYVRGMGQFVYGKNGDIPVPADYNGDGKDDIAVFRPSNSTWYIRGMGQYVYGNNGDVPVPADYNGDGKDEIAIFRPSNGTWYIRSVGQYAYGKNGDIPLPADYNGDGSEDIAIYRPSNTTWYVRGVAITMHGQAGDIPVPADYNGDGTVDLAVFRPSNSTWDVLSVGQVVYGASGDLPVASDYNGDGQVEYAVFRAANSTWYLRGIGSYVFGANGDTPAAPQNNLPE